MLSVLSLVALGALEECLYMGARRSDPDNKEDCSSNVNEAQCVAVPDDGLGKCTSTSNNWVKRSCSGSTVKLQYHAKTDCSDNTSATCVFEDIQDILDPTRAVTRGCHMTFSIGQCETYMALMGMGVHIKYTGTCPAADDEPCFSREAEACRVLDTSVAPSVAFRACFDEPAPTVAERVKMTALTGGDYVLSADMDQAYAFTRVIVNKHKLNKKRSSILKIVHADGEIELTPDHVLLVDGQWAAAHTVKVGSSLSGSKVTAISHGVSGVINPVTVSGMIVAAGATGRPVVSSAYPEWLAQYMLEQNYPLPVSKVSIMDIMVYLFNIPLD